MIKIKNRLFNNLTTGGCLTSLRILTAEAADTLRKGRKDQNNSALLFAHFAKTIAHFAVKGHPGRLKVHVFIFLLLAANSK